jgi:hypothetical protein
MMLTTVEMFFLAIFFVGGATHNFVLNAFFTKANNSVKRSRDDITTLDVLGEKLYWQTLRKYVICRKQGNEHCEAYLYLYNEFLNEGCGEGSLAHSLYEDYTEKRPQMYQGGKPVTASEFFDTRAAQVLQNFRWKVPEYLHDKVAAVLTSPYGPLQIAMDLDCPVKDEVQDNYLKEFFAETAIDDRQVGEDCKTLQQRAIVLITKEIEQASLNCQKDRLGSKFILTQVQETLMNYRVFSQLYNQLFLKENCKELGFMLPYDGINGYFPGLFTNDLVQRDCDVSEACASHEPPSDAFDAAVKQIELFRQYRNELSSVLQQSWGIVRMEAMEGS